MKCSIPCFLNSLAHKSVILNKDFEIKFANNEWFKCLEESNKNIENDGLGQNYIKAMKKINDLNDYYHLRIEKGIKDLINKQEEKFELEYPNYLSEKNRWFKMIVTPFDEGVLIMHENITERKEAQIALKLKEKQYRKIFNKAPIGIVLEDPEGNILEVNEALCKMTGYDKVELENSNIFDKLVDPKRIEEAKEDIKIILNGQDLEFNLDNIDKNGKHYYTHFKETKIDLPNHGTGILSMQVDLTSLRKKEKQLQFLSYHDQLTKLYNRTFFEEELNRLDTKRQLPLSIMVVDVNGLKIVNDTYGHSVGDQLIKSAADLLKNSLREEDILARFGGDEFAVILPQTNKKAAEKIIKRIKENSREIKVKEFELSLGIGVATKTNINKEVHKVFNIADSNMYKDKLTKGRSAKNNLVKNLINTLGVKSNETKEHALRVEKLALKLGYKLNLSNDKLNNLSLLATLHDIGKVTISEDVLKKPAKLNKDEWRIMKEHTERGYSIASSTDEFASIAKYILHHHERWDGTGYPEGLKGENIPLLSRIIALVDSFDVMTHERPYSKAISRKEALEEIKKCSGTQFDPILAKIFVEMFQK